MPKHKDKKEKKTTISQNKKNKTKKKSLKKKLHPKKKPPARSKKPTYYKKYVKPSVQSYSTPTPIPTHHNFIKDDTNSNNNINNINSTKNTSSFSSSTSSSISSIFSSQSSYFISYSTPTPTSKNDLTIVSDTRHLNSSDTTNSNNTALAAAAAGGSAPTSDAIHHTNQTMQIAGSIIGIFGGISLIAALVFITARYKKRRQPEKEIKKEMDEGHYGDSSFDSDENTGTKKLYHSELTSNYPSSYNNKPSDLVSINKTDQKSNKHDLQRRLSYTDTLVDSQTASRPNSVALKATAVAASAADASQKQASQNGTRVSWQSVSSSLLSDTISPTSTLIGTTTTSFMKTAERQLLHHERPSILDHFDGQFKKNIETYKAQLADISNPLDRIDEQEGQLNDDI